MAKPGSAKYKDVKLEISGSTKFGRYPKISTEQTFNMILSDDWLTPFAGYKKQVTINPNGEGRGEYSSTKLNTLFVVIDNVAYKFDTVLTKTTIGNLQTFVGDVSITENNAGQILFSDNLHLYLYNFATNVFSTSNITPGFNINFVPGFVTFQNGRFISPAAQGSVNFIWALSDPNNGLSWPDDAQHRGSLQTKADKVVACVRFPGRGNTLLVFGTTVAEPWQDVGAQLFPYQRNQTTNLDYGCINPATIASNENIVCWLGANEKSGPAIMYTNGGDIKRISTDGIDFKLATLTNPTNCYAFMFRQDGHVLFVVTWPTDNLSYVYDFNTEKFFTLCDENMNAFIAKRVVFFNNQYYFVSIKDGNLYELGSQFTDYDYGNDRVFEIPRIRITPPIFMPDQSRFVAGYSGFTIEQGQFDYDDRDTCFILANQEGDEISTEGHSQLIGGGQNYRVNVPRIDLSISKDGGVNFGSDYAIEMKPQGRRQNRLMWRNLGASNNLVHQFRFWGFKRFVATDGITGVYQ